LVWISSWGGDGLTMTNIRRALQAAAGGGGDATYVEDVYSTYVYTGTEATLAIVNGIDFSGEGGMAWFKSRSSVRNHFLQDTLNGGGNYISSSTAGAEASIGDTNTFNSDGFTLAANSNNNIAEDIVAWSFRKAPGFFDVVTYTGTGVAHAISHSLDSVPGCIMVKNLSTGERWVVYHRSNTAAPATEYLVLNTTTDTFDDSTMWNDTLPTSTQFTVGIDDTTNKNLDNYVAYLFAHDAQIFGADEDESIIACGGYTGNSAGVPTVVQAISLGWEAQYVMLKKTSGLSDWLIFDSMRGVATGGDDCALEANDSAAEDCGNEYLSFTADGFQLNGANMNYTSDEYIYMAIRRPMKVPEAGTEVFTPIAYSGTQASAQDLSFSMVPDVTTTRLRNATENNYIQSRLTGANALQTNEQDGRATSTQMVAEFDVVQKGIRIPGIGAPTVGGNNGPTTSNYVCEAFRRAPGFLDVCAWAGTSVAHTIPHNLTVVPEMMWVKRTDGNAHWAVYGNNENTKYAVLDTDLAAATGAAYWNSTSPTSSVFTVGDHGDTNASGENFCAWLWATVAGVSKVGSYTGTGSDQNIDCGFSSSARFVMIKPWDAAGDWIYLDSARGLTTTPTEPYLPYNTNAVETTSYDYVRGHVSGFSVIGNQTISNNSGTTYIFLAIA